MTIEITYLGTATVIININGYKILTDPSFDHLKRWYYHGFGAFSKKNQAKKITIPKEIDLVLLSHHQHKDNLDHAGLAFVKSHPNVLSTRKAAKKMSHITPLDEWQSLVVSNEQVRNLKITAIPAIHRPRWFPEFFSGKVIGFAITCDELNGKYIYITGDTVLYPEMRKMNENFHVGIAITHIGGALFPWLSGKLNYTMSVQDLDNFNQLVKPDYIFAVHFEDWTHFEKMDFTLVSDEVSKKLIVPAKNHALCFHL